MRYNLSAHADRTGLLDIISEADPDAIMLVHGEPGPQRQFRSRLEALGQLVVNNDETWDSEAPIRDTRRTRWRHSVRHSHQRRPR
jgi:Cft2 family RNA processing exonuclease